MNRFVETGRGLMIHRSEAFAFDPGQPRDDRGRWSDHGGTAVADSPDVAVTALAAGHLTTVTAADAANVIRQVANTASNPVDLTNLDIIGTPLFQDAKHGLRTRAQMPQIPSEQIPAFRAHLEADGVNFAEAVVDPVDLRASQSELDAVKVGGMIDAYANGTFGGDRFRPWVSNDGHILDGHHRWAALAAMEASGMPHPELDVLVVDMPIADLLGVADEFNLLHRIEAKQHGMTADTLVFHRGSSSADTVVGMRFRREGTVQVFHLQGQHDQKSHGRRGGSGKSIPGVGNVDDYLAANPRQGDEPIFVWHGRLVDGLPPDVKHALLFEIRERCEVVPFIADGMSRWREMKGLPEPQVAINEVPAPRVKGDAVARVFEEMPDMAGDPRVQEAFTEFKAQNEEMYQFMTAPVEEGGMGVKVEFWTDPNPANFGNGPYADASAQAEDLRQNRRIKLESGLGGAHDATMTVSEYDRFRAVHDVFGHAGIGSGFDRHGEYQAYLAHASMYTGDGHRAMASEYHGVNTSVWGGEPGSPGTGKSVLLPEVLIANPWDSNGNLVPIAADEAWAPYLDDDPLVAAAGVSDETMDGIRYLIDEAGMEHPLAQMYDDSPWHHTVTMADSAELAFSPNQPRYPAGHPQGGQWVPTGDAVSGLSEPDAGFTRSVASLQPVESGYAVALSNADRLVVAADAFDRNNKPTDQLKRLVRDRIEAAVRTGVPEGTVRAVGAWHNPADGKIEVNVTAVFPADQRDAAVAFAQAHDQIAIANLDAITAGDWDNAIINTGGTGGARDTEDQLAVRRFRA